MNDRKIINFTNTDEDRKVQAETIIPYWENRSTRHKIIESMTQEWRDAYEAGIFTEFMEQRRTGSYRWFREHFQEGLYGLQG